MPSRTPPHIKTSANEEESNERTRVLIVDDHEIVREGLLASFLGRYNVVGAVSTGAEALEWAQHTGAEVVIIDFRLPDMSGDELCLQLREYLPNAGLVILTTYVSEETVRRAFRAGASAYVTKAAGLPELLAAVDRVARERTTPDPNSAPQIVTQLHALVARRMDEVPLTPQQESVLELAAQGLTNHEIGSRLFISESTVRFHLQKLKAKFEARSKTDLIAKALRAGVITQAPEDSSPTP